MEWCDEKSTKGVTRWVAAVGLLVPMASSSAGESLGIVGEVGGDGGF